MVAWSPRSIVPMGASSGALPGCPQGRWSQTGDAIGQLSFSRCLWREAEALKSPRGRRSTINRTDSIVEAEPRIFSGGTPHSTHSCQA
jgi:hypothetical protein